MDTRLIHVMTGISFQNSKLLNILMLNIFGNKQIDRVCISRRKLVYYLRVKSYTAQTVDEYPKQLKACTGECFVDIIWYW